MDLKKILATTFFGVLIGCSPQKEIIEYETYKELILQKHNNGLIITEYDSNHDARGDLKYFYELTACDNNNMFLRLIAVQKDKNNDGYFSGDEIVWQIPEKINWETDEIQPIE